MSRKEASCPSCGRHNCLTMRVEHLILYTYGDKIVQDPNSTVKKIECKNCGYIHAFNEEIEAISKMGETIQMNDGDLIRIDGALLRYDRNAGVLLYDCALSDATYRIEGKEIHYYGQGRYKFVKGEDNENNPS